MFYFDIEQKASFQHTSAEVNVCLVEQHGKLFADTIVNLLSLEGSRYL